MHYHMSLPQPIHILQIIPTLHSGGVERATLETNDAILQKGWKSYVISNGGKLVKLLEEQGAIHINLPVHSKNPWVILKNAFKLKKIVKEYAIDLIHVRSRAPSWSCFILEKFLKCNIPWITSFHGAYEASHKLNWIYSSVMVRGHATLAVSEFIEKYIGQHFSALNPHIHLIRNGVDLNVFQAENILKEDIGSLQKSLNLDPTLPIILMPGRPSAHKGQHILMEALKHLHQPLQVIFLGLSKDHKLTQKLHQQSATLPQNIKTFFIPPQTNMPLYYALADVVVLPSLVREAFGRGAVEAGAMEKIVIATNHGGFQETILDKTTGYLIAPNNSEALAKALQDVLQMSPQERQAMGQKARQYIFEHFNLETTLNLTLSLYQKLILR
jgi:glycosyltransferase involved in cell wall biosynthesis